MEDLLRDSDYAFRSLRRGETVEGTVVRVDQDEVMVDVGLKSEGVIPARELYAEGDDAPALHVGDRQQRLPSVGRTVIQGLGYAWFGVSELLVTGADPRPKRLGEWPAVSIVHAFSRPAQDG